MSPLRRSHLVRLGGMLDPKELCRRLELYQLEERDARRRRRARPEPHAAAPVYRHTPVFAAVDFARTATPDLRCKKDIHKLSRPALRTCQEPGESLSPTQFVQRQEKARLKMEAAAERNQFQLTKVLEDAQISDIARNINKRQQHNFHDVLMKPGTRSGQMPNPPTSPEPVIDPNSARLVREEPTKQNHAVHRHNDRHDWAQRDECVRSEKGSLPLASTLAYKQSKTRVQGPERKREILAEQLSHRTSHTMLRSLFKRQ